MMRRRWAVAALLAALVGSVVSVASGTSAVAVSDPVVMAAGDIACAPGSSRGRKCRDDLTAELLADATHVVTVGDNQYNCGQLSAFQNAYDKTWGQWWDKTYPVVGEDDYSGGGCSTPGAEGFFTYFGERDGQPARHQQGSCTKSCQGWYSYDIGDNWHVVALNTNCTGTGVGGCSASSPQVKWLKADLADNSKSCVLAVMHRPYWANGNTVNKYKAIVEALYAGDVDVLLTGNSHLYARYAQQTPSSKVDTQNGIRAFIVGMGGKSHSKLASPRLPNFQAGNDTAFGVLALTLHPDSYDWEFKQAYPVTSNPYTDTGTTSCH
jgi:hypothetical protein